MNKWIMKGVNKGIKNGKRTGGFGRHREGRKERSRRWCVKGRKEMRLSKKRKCENSLVVGKVSSGAMDCKRQSVQIPLFAPSRPPFKLQKLILEILLAWQKRPLLPIFHISYTAHWKASSTSVMAWHIYERCIEELITWKICLSSAFWKSLCTIW